MSGRWRSRHWQSEQERNQLREVRNRSRERQQHHGNNNDSGEGYREFNAFNFNRTADGNHSSGRDAAEFHQRQRLQQQQQQQQEPDHSTNMPRSSWTDHRNDRGEWRRGQQLSSSSSSDAAMRGGQADNHSREPTAAAGRGNDRLIKKEHASNDSRSGSVGRAARPATFPAPPTQAWGNGDKPLGRSPVKKIETEVSPSRQIDEVIASAQRKNQQLVGKKTEESRRGWLKPDSNKSHNAVEVGVAKKQSNNSWPKPNAAPSNKAAAGSSITQTTTSESFPLAAEVVSNSAKSFPTGIMKKKDTSCNDPSKVKNSNLWVKPAAAPKNDDKLTKMATLDNDPAFPPWNAEGSGANNNKKPAASKVETTPSPSLPPTSSWGKNRPSVQSPAPTNWAKPLNQRAKKSKVQEFPSLSTASKIPRNTQLQQNQKTNSAKAVVTPTNGKPSAKGSSKGGGAAFSNKKSANPSANLASFLSPQVSGASSSKAGPKKKQTTQKSTTKKGNTNNNKAATSQHHAGMASSSMLVGMKRSAPSSMATMGNSANGRGVALGVDFPGSFVGGNNEGKAIKKGRQRLTPRKKKLTTLKKRVLQERLRVWKERNGIVDEEVVDGGNGVDAEVAHKRLKTDIASNNEAALSEMARSTTLLVQNFIFPEEDDLVDDDEYDEIISNLISLAGRVGKVLSVFVPRPQMQGISTEAAGMEEQGSTLPAETQQESKHVGLAFVWFATNKDVCAAKDILDGMIVGGHTIHTSILHEEEMGPFSDNRSEEGGTAVAAAAPSAQNDRLWSLAVLRVMDGRLMSMNEGGNIQTDIAMPSAQVGASASSSTTSTIIFHNILCNDDYEDRDALEESTQDIKGLAQQYGRVEGTRVATSGDDKGNVYIVYRNHAAAKMAVEQLNGLVVGGSKIAVSADKGFSQEQQQQSKTVGEVILNNVLNDDDFKDEDCFHESMEDIRNLALKYGRIGNVDTEVSGEYKGRVIVSYLDGHHVAQEAAQMLNGMVVGGVTISASTVSSVATKDSSFNNASENDKSMEENNKSSEAAAPPPMYSGDKILPERFAACKRVPKIPNPGTPRSYAKKISDERATPTLIEMLGTLMRLQVRSKDDKNARARRRLVMGLREVARGIRAHKVKMVIMANNLDDYGAIDSKLQEILDLARGGDEEIPVLFELNKRKLGKALGKSIKVSVVGIQNADGAHEQFKKLKKMMGMA